MGYCECFYSQEDLARIKKSGAWRLWALTITQLIYFLLYSVAYTLMWNQRNNGATTGHFLSADDWYRWILILILEVGQIFFLFKSIAVKTKNPNELFSYLTLTSLMNVFFLYKLITDTILIQKNYIQYDKNTQGTVNFLPYLTFIMAILGSIGVIIIVILIFVSVLPLRQSIYEDIFWEIGGNADKLAVHKART